MPRRMRAISRFVRWQDWGPGKIPVLCTVLLYLGLASKQVSSPTFAVDFAVFVVYASLHSALGYVINNWGDRDIDISHGKPNAFTNLTRTQGLAALAVLLFLSLLSGLPLVRKPMVLLLWMGWIFFAFAYSLPPLRLKERGAWGLSVSFVAQWSLPVLLAFAALNRFGGWDMIIFAVAVTVSGATLEVAHQRWDRARDMSTRTGTLAARLSISDLDRILALALILDRVAIGAVLIVMRIEIPPMRIWSWALPPALPLLGIYAVLFPAVIYEGYQASRNGQRLDPYYASHHSAAKLLHATLPNLIMPIYLMILAAIYQPINGLLLSAFLYWRLVLGQADWRWPFRFAKEQLQRMRTR